MSKKINSTCSQSKIQFESIEKIITSELCSYTQLNDCPVVVFMTASSDKLKLSWSSN